MQSVYCDPVQSIDRQGHRVARRSNARPGFASQTTKFLSIIHIIGGSLFIILGVLLIYLQSYVGKCAAGVWCGTLLVIGGVVGLAASKRKTNALILTYLTMSTINAVTTCTLIAISGWGIYLDAHRKYYHYTYGDSVLITTYGVGQVAVNACLLVLGLVLGISTVWSAAVCFKAAGCCSTPEGVYTIPSPQVMYSRLQGAGGQQVLVFSQDPTQASHLYALPSGYVLNQQGQMMVQIPSTGVVHTGIPADVAPANTPVRQHNSYTESGQQATTA